LRRERVVYEGETYRLPVPGGPGKALKLTVHPVREEIPVYLASVGPKNLELTGEIADGWLAIFFSPEHASESMPHIAAGRAKVGKTMDGFDVVPTIPLVVGEDWRTCADAVRGYAALYVGGMGSREKNFYNSMAVRMGYADAAAEVQNRYLAKDYAGAMAALPVDFLDAIALLGPKERIADKIQALAQVGVTTLTVGAMGGDVTSGVAALRTAVDAVEAAGVA
jgi:alkanesulfonate monooxygenase SsuD/methylene tetrahydromethanopterin reductase-like flavin-dependent oxidoreductase (luciferase family)